MPEGYGQYIFIILFFKPIKEHFRNYEKRLLDFKILWDNQILEISNFKFHDIIWISMKQETRFTVSFFSHVLLRFTRVTWEVNTVW